MIGDEFPEPGMTPRGPQRRSGVERRADDLPGPTIDDLPGPNYRGDPVHSFIDAFALKEYERLDKRSRRDELAERVLLALIARPAPSTQALETTAWVDAYARTAYQFADALIRAGKEPA